MNDSLFCGYGSLFHFLVCFVLAGVVFLQGPKRRLNQLYALWSISVAIWFVGYFVAFISKNEIDPLFWFRFSTAAACWIPAFHLHYCLAQLKEEKTHVFFLGIFYFASLALSVMSFIPWMISGVEARNGYSALPVVGLGYLVFVSVFFGSVVTTLFILIKKAVQKSYTRAAAKQLRMNFTLVCIAYIAAGFNFLLVYDFPAPLAPIFIFTGYMFFMACATMNYRLWYSEYVLRQAVTLAALAAIFTVSYYGSIYLLNQLVGESRELHVVFAAVIAFFSGYFIHKPVAKFISDRFLFGRKYNYQKLLKDASRGMSKIKSLDHLLRLVVHFITMKMRVYNVAVLIRGRDDGQFHLRFQRGYERYFIEYSIPEEDPLIQYLLFYKEAVDIENVNERIALKKKGVEGESEETNFDFEAIKQRMEELQVVCCVPSFLGRELKNILVLGEKRSEEFYTEADLSILYTLAQESAIAIENAGLYDEALKKTDELGHINEQLEYSKSLLMKALNETEVANKQLQDTQAQLIHEQKMATLGRLAASVGHEVNNPLTILSMNVSRVILKYRKNPDLKVAEILELFQKMDQNIGRIKAVVNTLTGLLKKSEKGKFEPLSLKLILEETLPLVQFQTYLDNLTGTEVEFDIPGNIPLVRGDLERLQEVFLNLFINAYHAMQGKRNRRIQVKAEIDPANSKMVAINFMDNGSGMKEETRKKIFNYGYTTKAPGKGSGLGLYMCKYIIELHGGDIRVESTLDVGTTFILTLPVYTEGSTDSNDLKIGASND